MSGVFKPRKSNGNNRLFVENRGNINFRSERAPFRYGITRYRLICRDISRRFGEMQSFRTRRKNLSPFNVVGTVFADSCFLSVFVRLCGYAHSPVRPVVRVIDGNRAFLKMRRLFFAEPDLLTCRNASCGLSHNPVAPVVAATGVKRGKYV